MGLAQLGTKFLASQLTPKPTPQLEHDAHDDHDYADADDDGDGASLHFWVPAHTC